MSWMITFFSEKVREETLSFPDGILADFLHVAEIIEQFGPAVGKPYTAPLIYKKDPKDSTQRD
jgi:hypothetical protein